MLERYLRQSAAVDQERLGGSSALIAGIGGLGNFVATELVLSGVGEITIIDPDVIEVHNLNRQFLFTEEDVGKEKARVAAKRLKRMNPHVKVEGIVGRWEDINVNEYDIVFDCLDTWGEKKGLMARRKGLIITGSVGEDVGFVSVLVGKKLPVNRMRGTCTRRVLGARVGVVGSIMANEGIRELSGEKSPLRDRLLHIDFRTMAFSIFGW